MVADLDTAPRETCYRHLLNCPSTSEAGATMKRYVIGMQCQWRSMIRSRPSESRARTPLWRARSQSGDRFGRIVKICVDETQHDDLKATRDILDFSFLLEFVWTSLLLLALARDFAAAIACSIPFAPLLTRSSMIDRGVARPVAS